MASILNRIEQEGPLMAKDFESANHKTDGWNTKPTKRALENLYMQGDLMISERRGFQKVYDLTSHVLPQDVDTSMPTEQEHARFLVLNYLKSHGFGTLPEMVYLLKGVKKPVQQALSELVDLGEIEAISINNSAYYACSDALNLLDKRLNRKRAKILSPFDNLLIQRKRATAIFNFDYLLECYVPEPKRQFGYFCLPILWDGKLVARADCKVDKISSTLNVLNLVTEPSIKDREAFFVALEEELQAFALFNQCQTFVIQKVGQRT
jgi:uncharacterized protein YcaQ